MQRSITGSPRPGRTTPGGVGWPGPAPSPDGASVRVRRTRPWSRTCRAGRTRCCAQRRRCTGSCRAPTWPGGSPTTRPTGLCSESAIAPTSASCTGPCPRTGPLLRPARHPEGARSRQPGHDHAQLHRSARHRGDPPGCPGPGVADRGGLTALRAAGRLLRDVPAAGHLGFVHL